MSNTMNQSATDLNDATTQNMDISEPEPAQGGKPTQPPGTADPSSVAGSLTTFDFAVGPTSNTSNLPTFEVDDSATLSAGQSDPGTSGEGQATAPSDSGMAVDSNSLPPPNGETNSMVQPGRQVFDSQLPPPLPGTLTIRVKGDGGQFADVYVGEWENTDGTKTVVAIKDIRCTDGAADERFNLRIRREAVIWKAAKHTNILRFIGYGTVEGIPGLKLVSPWCQHGNLTRYITNNPELTRAQKIDLLYGAARGLEHLHSRTPVIVHGDIKPANVVIQDNLEAALCDFGLSRIILDLGRPSGLTATGNRIGGTAGYQSKELLEGNTPTPAADVYAFGGLILAALSGKDPLWNRKNDAARIVATCMDQIPVPQEHPGLPEDDPLWGLLRECWHGAATERPTVDTVLRKLEEERDVAVKAPVPSHLPTLESELQKIISVLTSHWPGSRVQQGPSQTLPAPPITESDFQTFSWKNPSPLPGTLEMDGNSLEREDIENVDRGIWCQPDGGVKEVAIKYVRPAQQREQSFYMRIAREIVIWHMATGQDSNILPFFGYQLVDGVPMLVSPWCNNGNLATYITKRPDLKRSEKLELLCAAARGLVHLHSLQPAIIHGNIKPENVVIQDNLEAVLCNFGLSRTTLDLGNPTLTTGNSVKGNLGYQAKELLNGTPPTPAVDVYAFGGLILAAMSGRDPLWNRETDAARIVATRTDQIPVPNEHPDLPEADPLWRLLRLCWSVDPINRPTVDIVLQELEKQLKTPIPVLWKRPPPLPGTVAKPRKLVDRGGYGDVYRGIWFCPDGDVKAVAVKCLRPPKTQDHEDQDHAFTTRIIREIGIWDKASGQHGNILPFIGYQVVDDVPMLISPWCKHGNLAEYTAKHPGLNRSEKLKLLCDAARGLAHLHSFEPQIFHGDIKPQNVIVQDNLQGALSDFGISRFILDDGQHSGLTTSEACKGTWAYQAKEILIGGSPAPAADIFAFGGLILATMSGSPPFWKHKQKSMTIIAISLDQVPDPMDHAGLPQSDSIWAILKACWSAELASRPSALGLLEDLEAEIASPEVASELEADDSEL